MAKKKDSNTAGIETVEEMVFREERGESAEREKAVAEAMREFEIQPGSPDEEEYRDVYRRTGSRENVALAAAAEIENVDSGVSVSQIAENLAKSVMYNELKDQQFHSQDRHSGKLIDSQVIMSARLFLAGMVAQRNVSRFKDVDDDLE